MPDGHSSENLLLRPHFGKNHQVEALPKASRDAPTALTILIYYKWAIMSNFLTAC